MMELLEKPTDPQALSVSERKNLLALTGLRAVAAYSVLLAHVMAAACHKDPLIVSLAVRLACFSMSLFFVLSGFVIQFNYASRVTTWRGMVDFFVARSARLYPLYLVVLIAYASYRIPFTRALIVIAHATLTQSWINIQGAFFPATWSISTEWFFYVAFAIWSVSGLKLDSLAHPARVLGGFIVFAIGALSVLFLLHSQVVAFIDGNFHPVFQHKEVSSPTWYWLIYFSPFVRILEFVVGVLVAVVFRARALPISHLAGAAAIGWCLLIILGGQPISSGAWGGFLPNFIQNFIYAPALAIILLYACQANNPVATFLGFPLVVLGGEISYSLYLLSSVGRLTALHFVSKPIWDISLSLVLTTLVSLASYRFIERPTRNFLRHRFSLARPAQTGRPNSQPS